LEDLCDVIRHQDDIEACNIAGRALARFALDDSLKLCESQLRGPDSEKREEATVVIGELGGCDLDEPGAKREGRASRCVDLLIPLLQDHDEAVRRAALWGLRKGDWPGWRDQAKLMLSDSSELVRRQAVRLLGDQQEPVDLPAVLKMFTDENRHVRERAIEAADALAAKGDEDHRRMVVNAVREMLDAKNASVRWHGLELLKERGGLDDLELVTALAADKDEDVREAALDTALAIAPKEDGTLRVARQKLNDKYWGVRKKAVEIIGKHGHPEDLELVIKMFKDEDEDVRATALRAAATLAPDRKAEFALQMVTDRGDGVAEAAIEILKDGLPSEELVDVAFQKLREARGESGQTLFELLVEEAPARKEEAARVAVNCRSPYARTAGAEVLAETPAQCDASMWRHLLHDSDCDVRRYAFEALIKLTPEETRDLAVEMLGDNSRRNREHAVEVLGDIDDASLVDDLLPLARDYHWAVRNAAIRALAKFDDMRVFSELVSSLNDVEEDIRELAEQILRGKYGRVPVLNRLLELGDQQPWEAVRARVDEINRWASQVGRELLGKPVIVYNYRQGLGQTRERKRRRAAEIEVSDTPVTSGHSQGEEIMKGLALHEIGHHLCDIGQPGDSTMRGIARSEGVKEIYDYLRDERLERILRSRRPEWGLYFDRLASYAFAQDLHEVPIEQYAKLVGQDVDEVVEKVGRGELPGRLLPTDETGGEQKVALKDSDMLAMPNVVPPLMAFLACLRCGFDPEMHPDKRVAKAIALVPGNLKDLSHPEVLEAAKRIGDVLGRSDQHKRDFERLRRMMRQHREIMRIWNKTLERMADAGQLPDWMRRDAEGIRENIPLEIVYEPPRGPRFGLPVRILNLGPQQDFPPLEKERTVVPDPAAHAQVVAGIRKHIRRLRSYLERLGSRSVDEYASRQGHRLDIAQGRKIAFKPTTNVLVSSREDILPDAYIGVLIDRSDSMEGEKLELAKAFGALVAESAKGLRGISGHVNAFDGEIFYSLGDLQHNAIASLTAGDGNNDAGGLARAAELALRSKKRNKLLIMVSDGYPTVCSVNALRNLVTRLTNEYGIVCAQAAVDEMEEIAFPRYVDLSKYDMDEAVSRFGNLLIRLTRAWR